MKLQKLLESNKAADVAAHIGEIAGDYWAERGLWKEGTAKLVSILTAAQEAGLNANAIGKALESQIVNSEGWQLEEIIKINKIALKVLGSKLVNLARVEDSLGEDDEEDW